MTIRLPFVRKWVFLFAILGLLVFLLYLYYFVGIMNVISIIGMTNPFYYALTFVTVLISVIFFSLAWHSLLTNLSIKISVRRAFLFTWVGTFVDAVVPGGWTGDLSKAYLISKASSQDTGKIAASVIGQKVLVIMITLSNLILGLTLLAVSYGLPSEIFILIVFTLIPLILLLIVVFYLSVKPEATKKILAWLTRLISFVLRDHWKPAGFQAKAEKLLVTFHEGIQTLGANPKALAQPIIFSVLAWGFDVSVVFLVFVSMGYPVPVDKVLIVYAITGSLQTSGVSLVGFTEIIMSSIYVVLGIPAAVSLTATLLTRLAAFWFKLLVAYVVFECTVLWQCICGVCARIRRFVTKGIKAERELRVEPVV